MKDPNDKATIDALESPRRGRPVTGKAKSRAQIQREYRERRKASKSQEEQAMDLPLYHACTGEVLDQPNFVYLLNASQRWTIIHALESVYLVRGQGWTDVAAAQACHLLRMGTGIYEHQLPPELFRSRD
ncbi:hypothetical protein D3C78_449810 [compost metagenome]